MTPLNFRNYEVLPTLVQHLSAKQVFAAQEPAGPKAWKDTPQELQRLKARGIEALLLARVVTMQGGRAQSTTEQVGARLGSLPLMLVGAAQKTVYMVTANVELKLVSTSDGSTLWYGRGVGSAYGKEGLAPAIDASLKAAFSNVINDLCGAQLAKPRSKPSDTPP